MKAGIQKTTWSVPLELVKTLRQRKKLVEIFNAYVLVRKLSESEVKKLIAKPLPEPNKTISDRATWGHYSENMGHIKMNPARDSRPTRFCVFPVAAGRMTLTDVGLMPRIMHVKGYSAVADHLHSKIPLLRTVLTPKRKRCRPSRKPKENVPPKVDALKSVVVEPASSYKVGIGTRPCSVRLTRVKIPDEPATNTVQNDESICWPNFKKCVS